MERKQLARYRIIGRLGAGGIGEVYRARDEQLDRDVAIKVLPASSLDDPTTGARLVREAKAAAALNHPSICTIHEVGEADGQAYIAMELVEGQTLKAILESRPISADDAAHYARQLTDALTHAHDRGIVHGNLKSHNVIVTPDRRVKVLDFGLAASTLDSDMTPAGSVSSDIRALGIVLSEMDAATRAFGDNTPGRTPPDSEAALTVTVTRRRLLWISGLAALAVASLFAGWRFFSGPATRSLAVLPFSNVANDQDLEYLCDGIADSLIEQISTLASFRVRPLTTAIALKGQSVDPIEAGRQLGVQTVLTGTLELRNTRLHLSSQLLDVATGQQLWANNYDREASDLLRVQDEIATAIMDDGLRVRLTNAERARLVRRPTNDSDAFDLYLQARHQQRGATEDDYVRSLELLELATVRDANFSLAYAAMSGTYAMMVTDGLIRPTDAWPQVSKYMNQALRLDPDLETSGFDHARAFWFDWDWEGAARARERFMRTPIGDFDPQVLRAMATEHWALGRQAEALKLAKRTRELDPRSPYLAGLEADYLLQYGQYDAAIALYEYAIRLDPENPNGHFGLAEARARLGRFDEAIESRRKAHSTAGDDALAAVLAAARGEQGYRAIERAWLQVQLGQMKERAATGYVSPLDFARVHAQLGEADLAFTHLDEAFEHRSPGLVFLKVDRAWDAVRKDPRFDAAVRRVGLP